MLRLFPDLDRFPDDRQRRAALQRALSAAQGTPWFLSAAAALFALAIFAIVSALIRELPPDVRDLIAWFCFGVPVIAVGLLLLCRRRMSRSLWRDLNRAGIPTCAACGYDDPDDEGERQSDRAAAIKFLRNRKLTLPAAIAAGDPQRVYHARSLPSTALIDETGTIVAYGVGLDGGRDVMRQAAEMMRVE